MEVNRVPFRFHFFKCAGSKLTASFLLITVIILSGSLYISLQISRIYFNDLVKSQFKSALDVQENFIEQAFDFSESWAEHMAKEPKLRAAFLLKDRETRLRFLAEHQAVVFTDTFVMLLDSEAKILYCANDRHQERQLWQHQVVRLAFSTQKIQSAIINDGDVFSLISAAPVFDSETDKTLLGMVIVGKTITHQFAEQIQKNTQIDISIVRDRAIMATTLKEHGDYLVSLPVAYTDYLSLLKDSGKTLEVTFSGKQYFVAAKKLARMDHGSGSIMLLKSRDNLETIEQKLLRNFLYLALTAFVLILVFSIRIAQNFIRPIHQLIETTYRIARGEKGLKVETKHLKDDFAILADNFNFMLTQIEEKNQYIQQQNLNLEHKVSQRTQELKKLTVAIEQNPSSIIITDLEGNLEYVNPRFTEITGYTSKEILGKNPRLLSSGLTQKETYDDLWLTLSAGKVWQGEFINQRKNGEQYWEHAVIAPIRNDAGDIINYVGIKEDITEYKRIEEQRTRFGRVLEDSLNEIYIFDMRSLLFVQVNKGGRENLGYSMNELKQLTPTDIKPDYTSDEFMQVIQPLLTDEKEFLLFKSRHQRKDGSIYPVEIHLQLFKSEQNAQFVAITQDISERLKAELLLKQAKSEAEKASIAKSQFVANMSHELRTPLNAILGFSQIMENAENLTQKQQENLQIINRSGDHLLSLINDILDFSKIEAGKIQLHKEDFDLHQLLDDLSSIFKNQFQEKALQFSSDLSAELPQRVKADKIKIRQILVNLIGNAVKFTPQGKISLRVSHQKISPEINRLYFEVEDTGYGIAKEDLSRVFQNFVQTKSGLESQKGTGLGLAISQQFAQLMGGEMTVESTLDEGSVFKFNMMTEQANDIISHVEEPEALNIIGIDSVLATRVLIVDDNELNRLLLTELLAPIGFELQEANNGAEAIESFKTWQPHLILMDMRMPVIDGYEASRQIKALSKQTVIIAVTASAFENKKQLVYDVGCDDYIAKPFQNTEMLLKIKKHLNLEYTYKVFNKIRHKNTLSNVLTQENIAQLPQSLQTELKQAITIVDIDRLEKLLKQLADKNVPLAEAIKGLVDDYEYEKLLKFFE